MKRIQWLGTSLNAVRDFPQDARSVLGKELRFVQAGDMPTSFKPMTSVGLGVYEIRVRKGNQYRLIYVAKFSESVYVLHAFVKKTPKTAPEDIELAQSRYASLVAGRTKKDSK
jgi:phage-related protein